MVTKSDKLIECYRRNSKRYYERHRDNILANKSKTFCEYCNKQMYTFYYNDKHKHTKRHIKNVELASIN
jgi:hypothetical protein